MDVARFTPAQKSISILHEIYGTLICAALVALLLSQRGAGLALIYVVPVGFGIWVTLAAYRAFVRRRGLGFRPVKAAIWASAAMLVAGVHLYYFAHARGDALRISEAAESFFKAHGGYPCSVRQLGTEDSADRDHRRLANLYCLEGQPHLWYFSSFRPYEMEEYDFQRHTWGRVDANPD